MNSWQTIRMIAAAALLAGGMQAAEVYNNIGAASGGADPVAIGPFYDSFTPTSTSAGYLSSLSLLLEGDNTSTGTLDIGLYADSSTSPGSEIVSLGTLSDSSLSFSLTAYDISLTSNPFLTAGTRYWIGLSGTTSAYWSWSVDISGTGVSGEYFANGVAGVFPNSQGPYQMDLKTSAVSSVPEPASFLLLFVGLAAVVLLRRASTSCSPKPKPSTRGS